MGPSRPTSGCWLPHLSPSPMYMHTSQRPLLLYICTPQSAVPKPGRSSQSPLCLANLCPLSGFPQLQNAPWPPLWGDCLACPSAELQGGRGGGQDQELSPSTGSAREEEGLANWPGASLVRRGQEELPWKCCLDVSEAWGTKGLQHQCPGQFPRPKKPLVTLGGLRSKAPKCHSSACSNLAGSRCAQPSKLSPSATTAAPVAGTVQRRPAPLHARPRMLQQPIYPPSSPHESPRQSPSGRRPQRGWPGPWGPLKHPLCSLWC